MTAFTFHACLNNVNILILIPIDWNKPVVEYTEKCAYQTMNARIFVLTHFKDLLK